MRRMVDTIFKQYGSDLVLTIGGEEQTVRGFFRAVSSTSLQSTELLALPLGEISRGQYAYMGPAEAAQGDLLSAGGKTYVFRRVEPYYYGDQILYYWGLCVERGGDITWA